MDSESYYTFNEYMKNNDNELTASMEDYMEMIYRLSMHKGYTRINELADALNVHPPSVTRMVQRLGGLNLLKYERYGIITLKEDGEVLGRLLINRHNAIETFLKLMGVQDNILLKETEKIEHTLSPETVQCLESYISFMNDNPDVAERFKKYIQKNSSPS
ncbi:transcriptional regulator MntR [Sedimentibacter sp.]|uniref:transcriptional regulator MntR n=1 Tax=Sedimentibacter sp. TaxID=1960295 RepID=UPI00289F684F|nr:transcriptional regulator MntR [Sedimentibacter sp.]